MPDPAHSSRITQTVTLVDLASGTRTWREPGIDAYWSPDAEARRVSRR